MKKPFNPTYTVDHNGCHICTSHSRDRYGYARLAITNTNGKRTNRQIHRLVYESHFGNIENGLVVRHKCDNPSCINPDHLIVGTHADNVKDRVERNRSAKGERNGRSKLSKDAVFAIRESKATDSQLARQFGVSRKVVHLIRAGKIWRDL